MADGDLVIVDASEDTEAIGKAVEITGLNGRGAVAGLHTLLLRKGGRLADGFKGYLQNFSSVREALVRMATGSIGLRDFKVQCQDNLASRPRRR